MNRRRALPLLGILAAGIVCAAAIGVWSYTSGGLRGHGPAERWKSTVSDANFELRVESRKETFSSAEPLDVVASMTYLGSARNVVIGHTLWGPIEFTVTAPGATLHPFGPGGCDELDVVSNVPLSESLLDLNGTPHPLRLAHGLHEVAASAGFRLGGCNAPLETLRTTIVVAVTDGPDDIPLFTDLASEVSACLLMRNGGHLTRSTTGLGVTGSDGLLRNVVWPIGYSARDTAGVAVLVGRDGEVIAREGDKVLFDALTPKEGPLWPCGDVEVAG